MKSKLLTAIAALLVLSGCGSPSEFKVLDFEKKRTFYVYSSVGLEPVRLHGGVIALDMPNGRRVVLRDYQVIPTQENFGKNLIVEGIE